MKTKPKRLKTRAKEGRVVKLDPFDRFVVILEFGDSFSDETAAKIAQKVNTSLIQWWQSEQPFIVFAFKNMRVKIEKAGEQGLVGAHRDAPAPDVDSQGDVVV